MSKRALFVSLTVVCIWLVAGVSFASPLADFSQGKTTVDVTWFPNLSMKDRYASAFDNGTDRATGRKGNFDFGLTSGLGRKWAVQYRQFNPETKSYRTGMDTQKFGFESQELNVLYELDQNLSAFAGWHQAKYTFTSTINPNMSASNNNVIQIGLIGTTQIAPKTHLFGVIGAGKDLSSCEIGLSYEVTKQLDFSILYRYKKAGQLDDVTFGQPYRDKVTAKGFGFGATYKF